jgi:pimeloyl-ACP methyl ester carboxylesterase
MRRCVVLALGAFLSFSCGGGGSTGPDIPQVRTQTATIGPDGGVIEFRDEILLNVPPGALSGSTTVSLSIYSRPFVNSPGLIEYPKGVNVSVTTELLPESGPPLELRLLDASAEDGSYLLATVGSSVPPRFTQSHPIRTDEAKVTLPLSRSDFLSVGRGGGAGDAAITVSYGRETRNPKPATFYMSSSGTYNPDFTQLEVAPESTSLQGQHVAIVLHGLNNTSNDTVDTAFIAERASINSPLGKYTKILLYNYNDTSTGIRENARTFTQWLNLHGIAAAKHVDVYGHSMGGLVARWAIEKEGLGQFVDRLITFGTPHKGVPAQIVDIVIWYFGLFPGARDLLEVSSFIQDLNATVSPWRAKILYCAFVGNNSNYFGPLGPYVVDRYRLLGWGGEVDGIVAGYSASPNDLTNFGVTNLIANPVFNLNHSDIAGKTPSNDPVNTMLRERLELLLRTQIGGVIR